MNYRFIGWMHEGKSDKVWGVIQLGDNQYSSPCLTFWGRR